MRDTSCSSAEVSEQKAKLLSGFTECFPRLVLVSGKYSSHFSPETKQNWGDWLNFIFCVHITELQQNQMFHVRQRIYVLHILSVPLISFLLKKLNSKNKTVLTLPLSCEEEASDRSLYC